MNMYRIVASRRGLRRTVIWKSRLSDGDVWCSDVLDQFNLNNFASGGHKGLAVIWDLSDPVNCH